MTVFKKYNEGTAEWEAIAVGLKGDKGDPGDPGGGLPTGGTAGQYIVKQSTTDFDTSWVTPTFVDAAGAVSAIKADADWNATDWDTAFGWGDHAAAGYLTSFTETDPTVPSHVKSITTGDINNWDAAFGWGDHALAGYLTSFTETDPTVSADIKAITSTQISNWDTAYGWGDHSTAGYVSNNGTATLSALTLTGEIDEQVHALSGTTPDLDPSNGTIQTWTLTGNSTPTATNFSEGESILLLVDDGASAYTITWPAMEWIGGSAPTLDTTNTNVIELWKVSTTLYGALVGVSS